MLVSMKKMQVPTEGITHVVLSPKDDELYELLNVLIIKVTWCEKVVRKSEDFDS